MRSYLVLTPPGGADRDHRSTLVLADGFSWLGLLLPWLWLFWRGLWLAGIVILALQIGALALILAAGMPVAGILALIALSLLVGLEGRHYHSEVMVRDGWTLETILFAQDLTTAEQMYFSGLPRPEASTIPAVADWAGQTTNTAGRWQTAGLGIFDHGGR